MNKPTAIEPKSNRERVYSIQITLEQVDALRRLQATAAEATLEPAVAELIHGIQLQLARREENLKCCSRCGSVNIHRAAWLHANTDVEAYDDPPTHQAFCPDCDEWSSLDDLSEFQQDEG